MKNLTEKQLSKVAKDLSRIFATTRCAFKELDNEYSLYDRGIREDVIYKGVDFCEALGGGYNLIDIIIRFMIIAEQRGDQFTEESILELINRKKQSHEGLSSGRLGIVNSRRDYSGDIKMHFDKTDNLKGV